MVCFGPKVFLVRLFGAPSWYHNVIQFRLKSVSVTPAPAQWTVTTITKRWYHQPHPPDTVSPPGKLKRYLVDNCVRFAESYERFLEKRYPKVFEVYRMFKVGIRDFIADTRMYYNVTTELWTGKSLNCFSRKELEIYKQYPKDVWKVSPTLIISALPFANYVVFPIAYMYPKWFLSPHFWSDKHKEMIWGEILAKRMNHCSPVIYYLGSQCRHMDEENPLKEKLQLAISKLKQTHQLTVDEILTLKPLFEDYPCHINKISIAYLRQLAMCNGLSMRRSKLVDDTLLLHYIDLAMGREGIENLSSQDLAKACYDRFLNPVGVPHKEQLSHLCQWLEISKEVDENSLSLLLHLPVFLSYNQPSNHSLTKRSLQCAENETNK
ncbi:LETM1 domain-containing protein 1 [Octopus sinensis]|uniref:LETM1 domain-containing protein 1 n=1 Tax=Octopus sinensis TaxID=2607531 RepID=A0A6P7TXP4_9MOLL|nr:LETM1 domain-containing protein 1 [Octopus sinensis]XP_036354367.1 LETM1 domain-containing protein 1 [Octopus sinensis]XP_036354369.1 LETM1 domain-containing protein 1 [Octopus sinensis]